MSNACRGKRDGTVTGKRASRLQRRGEEIRGEYVVRKLSVVRVCELRKVGAR